ncbi:unnamed protein product [Anisakis simplex]|uniref:Uncharacterized protein n=1 Tax=Anisakis simplex TaxID=6269 RepID=A0A3P6QVP4_ANISI|nr:unnamed protein product [Anisakis simplex]
MDYEPDNELDITSSELPKAHSQRSPEHTELPPAAVVEPRLTRESCPVRPETALVPNDSQDVRYDNLSEINACHFRCCSRTSR